MGNDNWNPPPPPGGQQQVFQGHNPQHDQGAAPRHAAQAGPHGVPASPPPPAGASAPQVRAPGASVVPTAAVMAAMRDRAGAIQAQAQQAGQGRRSFFDISGPNGGKWGSTAYVGYEGERAFYFMGAYDVNHMNFVERVHRFYKSPASPAGKSLYAGDDSAIAQSLKMLYDAGQKPDWFRPRRQVLFQGFPLEYQTGRLYVNLQAVVNDQGRIRPMLYRMSSRLFTKLKKEVQVVGYSVLANRGDAVSDDDAWEAGWFYCFNEDHGRPFKITKRKTGAEDVNVEYELQRLEPMPLPQEYRPGLAEPWLLHEQFREASVEEQLAALIEVGYPVPPGFEQYVGTGPAALATAPVAPPQGQWAHGPAVYGQQPPPPPPLAANAHVPHGHQAQGPSPTPYPAPSPSYPEGGGYAISPPFSASAPVQAVSYQAQPIPASPSPYAAVSAPEPRPLPHFDLASNSASSSSPPASPPAGFQYPSAAQQHRAPPPVAPPPPPLPLPPTPPPLPPPPPPLPPPPIPPPASSPPPPVRTSVQPVQQSTQTHQQSEVESPEEVQARLLSTPFDER